MCLNWQCTFYGEGNRKKVFICGNGGSAANADHLANDFIYAIRDLLAQA